MNGPFSLAFSSRVLRRSAVLVALLFAIELFAILLLTEGQFTYSLDDPYIHLALAKQILAGHYGISEGVPSSPSSSIIWPFLLVPWAKTPMVEYVPLAFNYLASVALGGVFYAYLEQLGGARLRQREQDAFVLLALILVNAVPLAFMGLEHSVQLLSAALVAWGLTSFDRSAPVSPWLVFAIAVGPLVRYESFALVLASSVYFWSEGRRRLALGVLGLSAGLPLAFSAFLLSLGLPPLPLSVLAKSLVPLDQGLAPALRAILSQLEYAFLRSSRGPVFLLLSLGLLLGVKRAELPSDRRLGLAALLPIFLHGLFGQWGRYELYVFCFELLILGWLFRFSAPRALEKSGRALGLFGLFVLLVGAPYVARLFQTPFGARSIRAQQGSMARVARSLDEPIAVNDLGLVALYSRSFVLDLYGLGSHEALQARRQGRPGYLEDLVRKHGVRMVAIYPSWFPGQVPRSWLPVADLVDERPWNSTGATVVTFYATEPEAVPRLREALEEIHTRPSAGESVRILVP